MSLKICCYIFYICSPVHRQFVPELEGWKKFTVFGASLVGGALFTPAAGAGLMAVAGTLVASSIASMFVEEVATLALGGKTNNTHLISATLAFANGNFGQAQHNLSAIAGIVGIGLLFGWLGTLAAAPLFGSVTKVAEEVPAVVNGAEKLVTPIAKEAGEEAAAAMGKGLIIFTEDDRDAAQMVISLLKRYCPNKQYKIEAYSSLENILENLATRLPTNATEQLALINGPLTNGTIRLVHFPSAEEAEAVVDSINIEKIFFISDGTMTGNKHGAQYLMDLKKAGPRVLLSGDNQELIVKNAPNFSIALNNPQNDLHHVVKGRPFGPATIRTGIYPLVEKFLESLKP